MSARYLGEIRLMTFAYAPAGWALCNGQTLSIQQYQALFSLLGTTYGGDGQRTFQLPNLQGRVPLHFGTQPGGPGYALGQAAGETAHTLTISEMAAHGHTLMARAAPADKDAAGVMPSTGVALAEGLAAQSGGATAAVSIYATGAPNVSMAAGALQLSGGNQPHQNEQPYLVLNFCIALTGVFPSQN